MNRITIGGGRWFDADAAKVYEDDTRWDGNNHISVATGSQWTRQTVYHTAGGSWVLETHTHGFNGRVYAVLSQSDAFSWLIDNGHHSAVSDDYLAKQEV